MRATSLAAMAACALAIGATAPARADSPYNKTFVGTANMCSVQYGTCTGVVPIHVFLAKSGRIYAFQQAEQGQMFSLGQYIPFGNTQQRFLVSGNTLVFEKTYPVNGSMVTLHGYLRAQGGGCTITGAFNLNGQPEPITFQGSCQVYDGKQ